MPAAFDLRRRTCACARRRAPEPEPPVQHASYSPCPRPSVRAVPRRGGWGGAGRGGAGRPAEDRCSVGLRTLGRDNLLEPHHILVVEHFQNLDLTDRRDRELWSRAARASRDRAGKGADGSPQGGRGGACGGVPSAPPPSHCPSSRALAQPCPLTSCIGPCTLAWADGRGRAEVGAGALRPAVDAPRGERQHAPVRPLSNLVRRGELVLVDRVSPLLLLSLRHSNPIHHGEARALRQAPPEVLCSCRPTNEHLQRKHTQTKDAALSLALPRFHRNCCAWPKKWKAHSLVWPVRRPGSSCAPRVCGNHDGYSSHER